MCCALNSLVANRPTCIGDIHSASAKVKAQLPGSKPDAEHDLKKAGANAGAKLDKAVSSIPGIFIAGDNRSRGKVLTDMMQLVERGR